MLLAPLYLRSSRVTGPHNLEAFNSIQLCAPVNTEVVAGDKYAYEFQGDSTVREAFRARVQSGVLRLELVGPVEASKSAVQVSAVCTPNATTSKPWDLQLLWRIPCQATLLCR